MNETTAGQPSIVALMTTLIRRWRLLAAVMVAGLLIALAAWYLRGREYVSEARFRPSDGSGAEASRLSGLAAQFGIATALGGDKDNVDFYAELVKSRTLLGEVAAQKFQVNNRELTYAEIYDIEGESERKTNQAAIAHLNERVSVTPVVKANIVRVRVTAKTAELSEQINRSLLDRVNAFNLERRQSKGRSEREFAARQLAESQRQLNEAENQLKNFLETNRRFQSSPDLQFEHSRLERRVELRQQVYTSLAEAYEKARLEEARDLPVITVLDDPEESGKRQRSLPGALTFAFVPILVVAVAATILADHIGGLRSRNPAEFAELAQARKEMRSALLPFRR